MGGDDILDHFNRSIRTLGSKSVVFYVEIDETWDDDYKFETALRFLPFPQQTKVISKKFHKDAKTALANQLLQRFISCLYLNTTDQTSLEFKQNQYGKPYLVGSEYSFSMSNQQGFTSMVVCPNGEEVGIDLASCSDVDKFGEKYIDQFQGIFHTEEYEILKKWKDQDELKLLFTEYWALKESYTKKLGVGLNGDLSSFNFQNAPLLHKNPETQLQNGKLTIRHETIWNNASVLYINSQRQDVDIFLGMLNRDIVVSVIGSISEPPALVKVPLENITTFFS